MGVGRRAHPLKFNGSFYLLHYVMVLTILQQTNPHRQ